MNALPTLPARRSVCALLTCFDRREKTLACLAALEASAGVESCELHAVLVDDGSRDGSAAAVRERFPWVQVIEAEGDLYWCRGMHRAFGQAQAWDHDFYLWLNDDTLLDRDAVARLLACHDDLRARLGRPLIVAGSTRDGGSGKLTYGGESQASGWRRLRFALVAPQAEPVRVDTFNGNIVLVSAAAAAIVGNLDPTYEHAMGDTDYGLRAGRLGVPSWLATGTHGLCEHNSQAGTYRDHELPWRRRWTLMLGRKGLPPRSWWQFTRRHGGPLWPALLLWPYTRVIASRLLGG
jgi:GT2 family glycosyltransferase